MNKKTLKLISLILVIATFVSLLPLSAMAEDTLPPANLVWDDNATVKKLLIDTAGETNTTKTYYDLTNKFPTPGNQGSQGSCTAWAVAYALKSGQENIKRGWSRTEDSHKFSPSFVYNQMNGGQNVGTSISKAMDFIEDSGVCSLNYFSYEESNLTKQPSGVVKAAATLYKASSTGTIKGVQAIKNRIANNDGVVIGVQVYPDFDNISSSNQVYNTISGTSRGGHAICLIGFDDSKGAFKFINSWGTSWGIGGYGWISYELVENATVNHHGAGIGYVMTTANDNYLLGDIDGNGTITAADSRLVLRYSSSLETFTNKQIALADVDGNAQITAADARYILQYSSRLISKMPLYD